MIWCSPDIVVLAEDHARLGVARGADLPELRLAARALEAPGVPVPLHGVQQEAVADPRPAPGARFHFNRIVILNVLYAILSRRGHLTWLCATTNANTTATTAATVWRHRLWS